MLPGLMGIVLCLALLAGCGGSKVNLVKMGPLPEEPVALAPDVPDESLTEELNSKRLEELYAKSGIPGWDPSLEEELKQWEHQVKFDVPIQMNKQVRAYLVYFSTERKGVIRNYLSRSSRYLPMIKEVFDEYGLPEDLAYLAMIESGFNNKATSPAAACGMWQFIKGTGLRYGLTIDSYLDERRDPEKATRAAAKYLLDLYKQFGSWYLAAASYNCGEGRVQRELDQSKHKNFWELSANMCLPTETKNYVPQMIAATIIAKNPEKFGFKGVPYQAPMRVDKVQVNEPTSLKAAAFAVNMQADDIQVLNPELLRGVTPPDSPNYALNLPPNSKELFTRNITLARIENPAVASRPVQTARSNSRQYSHSRGQASHQVAPATPKAAAKPKTYAKGSQQSSSGAVYAKKGKTPEAKEAPAPVQASLFGGVAAAPKHGTANKANGYTQSAANGKAKGKTTAKAADKKGEPAGKATPKAKTAKKNGAPAAKSKDKYSKAKSVALFANKTQ
ncbi:MAG: transglycosylase SLT domain-containing protein [Deltaproteobacteria bacterium]|nr:transglycosylase SLT domain-containing protein [Deltaproteobacteria bacterium]